MTDDPKPTRTDLVREQPWVLVVIGVALVAAAAANDGGALLALVGFLIAVAGTALWVVKIARRDG